MTEIKTDKLVELQDVGEGILDLIRTRGIEKYIAEFRRQSFEEVIVAYAGVVFCAYFMDIKEVFRELSAPLVLGSIGEVIKYTKYISSDYGITKTLGELHERSGLVEDVDKDFGSAWDANMYTSRSVTPALPFEWARQFVSAWQNGCRNPVKAVVQRVIDIETSDSMYPRFPTFKEIRKGVPKDEWVERGDEDKSLYWMLTQATLAVSDLYDESNKRYRNMKAYVGCNNEALAADLGRGQEIEPGGACEPAFCPSAYTEGGKLFGVAKDDVYDVVSAMGQEIGDVYGGGEFEKQVPALAALIEDQQIGTVAQLREAYVGDAVE